MSPKSDSPMDEAILSVVEPSWRKVASVIGRVLNQNPELPNDDASCERIASRIQVLVSTGRLEAQGDIKYWRYSEVRKPQ
jgi:hypothetical protein